MYNRRLEPLFLEILSDFRILYLTGPRQSGKTTLVRSIAKKLGMDYLTLDNQAVLESVRSDPHGFIRSLGKNKVVLDEFQYAPSLIPAVKEASDALDADERGKFILTGSADIFRSALAQEALPGHMARLELYPLSISEITGQSRNIVDYLITNDFQGLQTIDVCRETLARILLDGGYPEVLSKSPRSKQIWFKSYIEGRLFKDFETLYATRGDYHSKLRSLVPYLAGLSGNLLKYASISNDLGLDDKLIKSYIEILELMFIVKRVPAYLKNRSKREATTMPKLQMVDTGLACHLLGLRNEKQLLSSSYYGGLLESFIYMEIKKHSTWSVNEVELYHFRDKHKNEVDIVLEQSDGRIIGIEVKASSSVTIHDFNGLVKLADFAGNQFSMGILFYSGQQILPFKINNIALYALPIGLLL
jgi:predicted AAA+ superfamily ATPase